MWKRNDYLVMTHEMAEYQASQIGDEVMDVVSTGVHQNALDFIL